MGSPVAIEVLIGQEALARRVAELGAQISSDYQDLELTVLVLLKGAFVFAADLVRQICVPLRIEFLQLGSYGSAHESSGRVELKSDLGATLEGRHVLVIEDIIDSGTTMQFLRPRLAAAGVASVKLATLLHKPSRTKIPCAIDYLGFEVPDVFVVGYGLDDAQYRRNLPFVGVLSNAKKE